MNDMERRKFEDSFQDAFRDAEMNPSAEVWTNIELDLEKAEGGKMKRRLLFYKLLAAASIAFAMCVAGIGYYVMSDQSANNTIAVRDKSGRKSDKPSEGGNTEAPSSVDAVAPLQQSETGAAPLSSTKESESLEPAVNGNSRLQDNHIAKAETTTPGISEHRPTVAGQRKSRTDIRSSRNAGSNPADANDGNASSDTQGNANNPYDNNQLSPLDNVIALTDDANSSSTFVSHLNTGERALPLLHRAKQPVLEFPGSNADPGQLLLARLDDEARKFEENERKANRSRSEKLWTSVGFSAGSFNANNPSVAPQANNLFLQTTNAQNTATKQSKASGLAYSVGVSMGTQISDRWVLQGGVNYMTQSSDYTANSVVVLNNDFASPQAESMNTLSPRLEKSADAKVAQTFPYNVNNQVRFVSVPMQAGYLLVNKKVGFQVNAGVSTDFFIENSINPDGGGVASTTVGRGAESPYRSLNFSGLMGTELSYRVGNHYRLSLNPGIRYPFSSIYKESTGVDANPVTFDVGLRFRYIFE